MTPNVPQSLRLSPSEAELLSLLMRRSIVSKESAAVVLGRWSRGNPKTATIVNFISRLRKRLPSDIVIETVEDEGYRLAAETKARVRALIEAEG